MNKSTKQAHLKPNKNSQMDQTKQLAKDPKHIIKQYKQQPLRTEHLQKEFLYEYIGNAN